MTQPPTTEDGLSPRDLAASGLAALEQGDVGAAITAIGRGLWLDPADGMLLSLADRLLERHADEAERLLALRVGMPAHEGALRARLLARRGALTEAVNILLQLAGVDPPVRYLRWAVGWLEAADADALAEVSVGPLLSTVAGVQEPLEGETAQWDLVAEVLGRLRPAHPAHPHLPALHALAMRNAGRHAEAISLARAAHEDNRSFASAVALAGTLRGAGQLDDALEAYREAEALAAPNQKMSPVLDRGDMLEHAGRFSEALAEYEAAQVISPEDPWGIASAHYVRHRLGDRAARYALWETWIAHPDHARARQLARRVAPFVGYLPEPWEALVQYARDMTPAQLASLRRQALASVPDGAEVKEIRHRLQLQRPEPPSAQWVARAVAAQGGVVLEFDCEGLPQPDPRRPRADDLRYALWRYEGDTALPALTVGPEAASLSEAVRQIAAREDFNQDYVSRAGRWMGEHLEESALESLLALCVSPPPAPEGMAPWDWLPRVQRICATAVAFLSEGWEGTARREALRSLILGPSDWTVVAGAWAAVTLAEADGTGAAETGGWILTRLREEPIDVFAGPTYGLAMALMFHPAAAPRLRSTMLDLIREAESHLSPATAPPPAEG